MGFDFLIAVEKFICIFFSNSELILVLLEMKSTDTIKTTIFRRYLDIVHIEINVLVPQTRCPESGLGLSWDM